MSPTQLSQVGRRHALLVSRARRLARPRKAPPVVASISCLVCEAAGELYGVPVARAVHVASFTRIAAIPTRNPALVGITSRAGMFYHVYDLTRLVGTGRGEGGRLVMLRGSPPIALRVDEVLRVADIVELSSTDASQIQANHPAVTGFARALQDDVFNGRTISLINPDKLASDVASSSVEGD